MEGARFFPKSPLAKLRLFLVWARAGFDSELLHFCALLFTSNRSSVGDLLGGDFRLGCRRAGFFGEDEEGLGGGGIVEGRGG